MPKPRDGHWYVTWLKGSVPVVVVVLIIGVASLSLPASADDRWEGNCRTTGNISTGVHSGTLSPADQDTLRVDLAEGDSVRVNLTWTTGMTLTLFDDVEYRYNEGPDENDVETDGSFSPLSMDPQHPDMRNDDRFDLESGEQPFYVKIFSEAQGPICIGLVADRGSGEWILNATVIDEEPPIPTREALEQELREKNETIQELQSDLERINGSVEELEERVEELEERVETLEGNSSTEGENRS